MDDVAINAVFQPKASKQEAKADTTTRVAREILDVEVAKREAKTERLRLARLERELAEAVKPAKPAAPKPGKAAASKKAKR